MRWNRWYSLKSYVKSSLWIVPFVALLLYIVAIRLVYAIDSWLIWKPLITWSLPGTQMILQTIVTLSLTFLVFTFGSLLVAIQVASGQLTPRIIAATLLCDNAIRFTVGLFIFTLLFAAGVLARLETTVPQGIAGLAGLLGFGSIAAFLYLIDYAARLLRPVSIVGRLAEEGRTVIKSVYQAPARDPGICGHTSTKLSSPDRRISHSGRSAIVLAVNLRALVAEARKWNIVIELIPRVGDFIASADPLFRIYGQAGEVDSKKLCGMVAFGPERTIEQDATFAFRIIVDIATKALSKAINDPTTAVLAIDQLQNLLRDVGNRNLHDDELHDSAGRLRVIFRTPNWEDFVQLTFSEIRLYGVENIQIARRLRAMIESLLRTLPNYRQQALLGQLELLNRAVEKVYMTQDDVALARVADPQGIGSALEV